MNNKRQIMTRKRTALPIKAAMAGMFIASSVLLAPLSYGQDTANAGGMLTQSWLFSPEQKKIAQEKMASFKTAVQPIAEAVMQENAKIDSLFLQPTPDQKSILSLQAQIDEQKEKIAVELTKMSLEIRHLLTPEQRQWLGLVKPSQVAKGIDLSDEQQKSYRELVKPMLNESLDLSRRRANLTMDQDWLLQEMDLVHACHIQKLDEDQLASLQTKIDEIDSVLANKNLEVSIAVHKLLTDDQRKKLGTSAEIVVLDPLAEIPEAEKRLIYAPPEIVYSGIDLSAEQKARYNSLMASYAKQLDSSNKARESLTAQRKKLLAQSVLDVAALKDVQTKINKIDADKALSSLKLIAQTRDVLTPQQRHSYFNRHHPKIWDDTGITEKQDHDLMVIHMKIEEADREGRRAMQNLQHDKKRLFFQAADNDEAVIQNTKAISKAESETTHKQLQCLFDNRALLTDEQRSKLVQLMQQDQSSH